MRSSILILLIIMVTACTSEPTPVPQGPDGSWWLGGDDGGVFIDIKDDDNPDDRIFVGTIYFDADKTIWYQGPLRLVGNIEFAVDDRDLYLGWDGERLHLKESSYLETVNPIPPL